MTKVTLIIETDDDEDPRQAAARFLGIAEKPKAAATNGSETVEWTPEDFTGFWKGLTDDAQALLNEIAKRPDGSPRSEQEKALNRTAFQLAGTMSSVGFQIKRY